MKSPFSQSLKEVLKATKTTTTGLSSAERRKRLTKHGLNVLPEEAKESFITKIIEQLKNPIVILLLVTAIIAGITGKMFDAGLIYAIVLAMAGIGIFLEQQSEKSLDQLKSLQSRVARVLIDGKPTEVPAEEVVVGDILVLHEGDLIAADGRVIQANQLTSDEAALTGESLPVHKHTTSLPEKTMLGDRLNMVFAGTSIIDGAAHVVVTAIGSQTEIGTIATFLNETEKSETPLQKELAGVGQFLLIATLVSVGIILSIYLLRGQPFIESLLTTTSLAIAFVPEGLSAVLTVSLALAVNEMVKKKVIVKRLLAAEGLGSITHIATDKTGTMTEGKMQVVKVYIGTTLYDVADKEWLEHDNSQRMLNVVRFCNNNKGPTEQALITFLEDHEVSYEIEGRRFEHRFTSELKRMSVIHEHQGNIGLYSKGAPEMLIPLCKYDAHSVNKTFSDKEKTIALDMAEELAGQGFRVLALADRSHSGNATNQTRPDDEQQLHFIGLVALMDPLRPTVRETVAGFYQAGIVPMMITGDHPAIARYIAEQAGIISATGKNELVLTGDQLDDILTKSARSDNRTILAETRVFARVKPEHKLLLIEHFQQQKYRIAMTGDGINDAAAIKKADVGIAMSNGVDLTKDIADVVITGTYDALLRAVGVGRTVKLRTQLYLHYLLSGNSCQVGIFFVAVLLNWPIPMTSIMLLLINLFTDALPAMAMAVEPEDQDTVRRKVSQLSNRILTAEIYRGILIQALLTTIVLSAAFAYFLPIGVATARTAVFTLYIFQKALRGFTARSFTKSVVTYGFFTNKLMNVALMTVAIAWLIITYIRPEWFGMNRLAVPQTIGLFVIGLCMPLIEEATKLVNRQYLGKQRK